MFQKENLIPWSIVGFDVKERTPQERLEMLKDLGFTQYAYGYRPKHIPTMAEEWQLAKEKGIQIKAVWLYINLKKDRPGKLKPDSEIVFENLKNIGLKTQIWVGFEPSYFEGLSDLDAFSEAKTMLEYLIERADEVGCKIALYNHGGWYGKSENQLKLINTFPKKDIGVVYNFHHSHENLDTYQNDINHLLPYLWCVNLTGMKEDGPKILTIGEGTEEKLMIEYVIEIGYNGPFGILGHVKGGDPETILQDNYNGLQNLFKGD
ncbi:sugar phosphate isomerase/epimerase family protein [Aegicerativicinus sediminis]|uniref:sugar phosphate isomerase/epimerase family protein n=1 Tax=Aegicerativicinus sediminis TaxID=2893202 RepID=UPI001E351E31|nr:hypothetical protein [Aegicerativicinus sediminis]